MPTYNIAITFETTRVADLVKDAAVRAQALGGREPGEEPLNALDWATEEARKLFVSIARAEYYEQEQEAGDPSKEAINSEVTIA